MPRTDENIKRDVVDQLYWDNRVNAADIKVEVLDNIVTLSGKVNTSNALYSAASDAWMIEGVTNVYNDLDVIYETDMSLPTDTQIKSQAENTLLWNEDIDSTNIDVSVSKGIVTLTGTVDSLWKKWEAEQAVYRNFGVISVENHLTIVPTTSRISQKTSKTHWTGISTSMLKTWMSEWTEAM